MAEIFDPRVNYNKTSDTDVKYTGPSYDTLGIKTGDKLSTVMQKTAEALSKIISLEERISALESGPEKDASSLKANSLLFDLVDHSEVVSHSLEERKVDIEVSHSPYLGKKTITFDFASSLQGLEPKYVPVGIETSVRTYDKANKLLGSSSSRTGSLTIDNQAGPVLVNTRVNLKTPDGGDLVLSRSFYLPTLVDQSLSGTFKVSGISVEEAKEVTQKQYNEILSSNISRIQKDLAALEKKVTTA